MAPLSVAGVSAALIGTYKPPQNKFPLGPPNGVIPRWQLAAKSSFSKSVSESFNAEDFVKARTAGSCYYPLEVLILQDSTESFGNDFPVMINSELDQMFEGITKYHPDSTFAVATFTDKPIEKFGWPPAEGRVPDWCYKLEQSLSGSREELKTTYTQFAAGGGYDYPENQFGALVNALQSNEMKWGSTPNAQRLIVISTDAPPHYDGDGSEYQGMKPFSGVFDEANNDAQCIAEFYPTPQQAIDNVLDTTGAMIPPYVAFIVYDGGYLPNNQTIESWRWFANAIKEDDRFVRDRTANSDNFWEELSKVIAVIDSIECAGTTTVFPPHPPTTSTTTTTTCRCPQPCPEPCHCQCGNSVYLRYPKEAKSVDLHVDYRLR